MLLVVAGLNSFAVATVASSDDGMQSLLDPGQATTTYVGSKACGQCHPREFTRWQDSAHAWAMRRSRPDESVADFDDASVSFGNAGLAAMQSDGQQLTARIIEPGSQPKQVVMRYFFGHEQIEQHVVQTERGRYQALPFGFDTKRRDWFDIFKDDPRRPGDWGHWTGRGMTANSECIFCHSTGYKRNYDLQTDSYRSSWAEMAVGCEACHGPGASHAGAKGSDRAKGYGNLDADSMFDTCASCHSLRRVIADGFSPGEKFLDYFEPVLLDEDNYQPNGAVRGEAYEWTSFKQSRMYRKQSRMYREDVRCPACHEIHGGRLKKQGNALCLDCHDASLNTPSHSHHTAAGKGSQCVACHMPERVFMQRDARRDHSFSVPDPKLSQTLSVTNACNDCHRDQTPEWASKALKAWFVPGRDRKLERETATEIAAARTGRPGAERVLIKCLDTCKDSVRRASAARLLGRYLGEPAVRRALVAIGDDGDDLVRNAAVFALGQGDTVYKDVQAALLAATTDPVRSVRVNAAWGLRTVSLDDLAAASRAKSLGGLRDALAEWETSQMVEAEDPESHHALGLFYAAQHRPDDAISAYRQALTLSPSTIPPRYNLSVLLIDQGREAEAEKQIDELLRYHPEYPAALYALGVLRVSRGATREAVTAFAHCLKVDRAYPGALHDLAHAYVTLDQGGLANYVLGAALKFPDSKREAMITLVTVNLALGKRKVAAGWAKIAAGEFPELAGDATVQSLLEGQKTSRETKATKDPRVKKK